MGISNTSRRVRNVLCTANLPDGRTLSIAELTDGRFAIYFDSAVSAAKLWKRDQLNACVNDYLAIKWEMLHPECALTPSNGA